MGNTGEGPRQFFTPVWVTAGVAAVLGPYLVSGLRTEQVAFYSSAAFVVLTQRRALLGQLRPARWLLALWSTYALIAVVGGLLTTANGTPWASGSLVAGLDNALLPLATIVTVCHWVHRYTTDRVVTVAGRALVVLMSLNGVLALVGCLVGLSAMPWLRQFWAADGSSTFVAELAEQMGRYSGVFNQPAEAGIAYTLAALSLAHLVKRERVSSLWAMVGWVLIVLGGLLTLSKVFVGGLVLAMMLVLFYRRRSLRMVGAALGTALAMVVLSIGGWFTAWGASTMFGWYRASVQAGDSFFYTVTAGRFGVAGTNGPPSIAVPVLPGSDAGADGAATPPTGVGELARAVVDDHPIFGFGARGLQVAYDSAWSEALVIGGLIGLGVVVLVHLVVLASVVTGARARDRDQTALLAAVAVLTLAGSMGMPALTGNRESTLLWIFIVALGFARRTRRTGEAPAAGALSGALPTSSAPDRRSPSATSTSA